jgi:hypothetical protein
VTCWKRHSQVLQFWFGHCQQAGPRTAGRVMCLCRSPPSRFYTRYCSRAAILCSAKEWGRSKLEKRKERPAKVAQQRCWTLALSPSSCVRRFSIHRPHLDNDSWPEPVAPHRFGGCGAKGPAQVAVTYEPQQRAASAAALRGGKSKYVSSSSNISAGPPIAAAAMARL